MLEFFRENRTIKYAGRLPSASPATGNKYTHYQEQKALLSKSLNVRPSDLDKFKAWTPCRVA